MVFHQILRERMSSEENQQVAINRWSQLLFVFIFYLPILRNFPLQP
jgi:hypothetical protein